MLALASVGGTRNALTKGMVEDFEINLPPLPTQGRVAAILSALDNKIELNRQTNATLEAIAQAIFKEWFVDFHYPGAAGGMQESELGLIPQGWKVGKLGDISEKITKGTTPTTLGDKFVGQGIRFLRAECIQDHIGIDESKSLFVTRETHDKLKRSQLAENDILITIAGTIGRIGIVTKKLLPANINQAIGIIRTDPSIVPMTYILDYLKQKVVKDELLSGITQSVQANISLADLNNLRVIIPYRTLLDEFDYVIANIREHIENLTDQSTTLARVRDNLLPRLMSGEIGV
jgi:type I restriction enzyme S subunit